MTSQEREVGFPDERVPVAVLRGVDDAGADAHRNRALGCRQAEAQALHELHRLPCQLAREDQGELVAADAVEPGAGVGCRAHGVGDDLDVLIAGLVAERVVHDLELIQVEQDQRERSGSPSEPGDGAREVLLEGSVVAQSGQRIARRELRQRRDLSLPGARQPAAEPEQDGSEGHDQRQPEGEHRSDRVGSVAFLVPQLRRLGQRHSGSRRALGVDSGLHGAVDRVDDLVVEARDKCGLAQVDRAEHRLAGPHVAGVRAAYRSDEALCRGRRIQPVHECQVEDDCALSPIVQRQHSGSRLEAVLALERLLLADPEARVRVDSRKLVGIVRGARVRGDAPLSQQREPRQEAQHGEQACRAEPRQGTNREVVPDGDDDRRSLRAG